MLRADLQQLLD